MEGKKRGFEEEAGEYHDAGCQILYAAGVHGAGEGGDRECAGTAVDEREAEEDQGGGNGGEQQVFEGALRSFCCTAVKDYQGKGG